MAENVFIYHVGESVCGTRESFLIFPCTVNIDAHDRTRSTLLDNAVQVGHDVFIFCELSL